MALIDTTIVQLTNHHHHPPTPDVIARVKFISSHLAVCVRSAFQLVSRVATSPAEAATRLACSYDKGLAALNGSFATLKIKSTRTLIDSGEEIKVWILPWQRTTIPPALRIVPFLSGKNPSTAVKATAIGC